jgi:prophage regulatory protein
MALAVLRLPEVMRRTGLRRSSIYNRIAANDFPRGFSLGGSARGWLESEVDDWIAARAAAREDPPQSKAAEKAAAGPA